MFDCNHPPTTPSASDQAPQTFRRPRVLLLAYSCEPERGSEPGIGWNRAVEIARFCDVWVVVRPSPSTKILEFVDRCDNKCHLNFVCLPHSKSEKLARRAPGGIYVAYNLWHRRAYRLVKRLHEELQFDLVHQLTFQGFREPSYLHRLQVPFAWGPVGGAQNYPTKLLAGTHIGGATSEFARNVLNSLQLRCSRRVRKAAKSAAALIAANSTNAAALASRTGVNAVVLPDVGIDSLRLKPPKKRSTDECFNILWCGVLETRKALELLIEALPLLPRHVDYQVRVVGDGPCRERWERLAKRHGVSQRIQWLGNISHEKAQEQFAWADCFAFTSLRDTTGTVLLEALAAATPIVCLDHQGAKDVVTSACGVKVPVTTRREIERGIASAIARFATDSQWWEECSSGAQQRAKDYFWSKQTLQIARIYDEILGLNLARQPETHRQGVAEAVLAAAPTNCAPIRND